MVHSSIGKIRIEGWSAVKGRKTAEIGAGKIEKETQFGLVVENIGQLNAIQ